MSKRRNGTNRAGAMVNASRYTGYGKPIKKGRQLDRAKRPDTKNNSV